MSDMNNAPPLPRGQMPIQEVFRMMWARMNYLETALKNVNPNNSTYIPTNEFSQENGQHTALNKPMPVTVDQLRNESTVPSLASVNENEPEFSQLPINFESSTTKPNITLETNTHDNSEVIEQINLQETRINEIWDSITEMKDQVTEMKGDVSEMKGKVTENNSTFNETIDSISTDLSEMNSKYTQMNNFLMEIQTTQITVNNQILRHYNENYSEMMESAIEKSAAEKFASKDDTENNGEEGDESGETEQDTTNSTVNASAKTEDVAVTDETENSKTMSFNIE